MNTALCILSLFLASSLILFCAESAANDIVGDTCKKIAASTPNVKYDYCMKSLGSDPKSRTAGIRGLGLIALNLLENSLTGTCPYIQHLLKQKWDRYVKNCLLDCSDLYSDLVETMKDAVGSYRAKRYSDAQFLIGTVPTNVDTCESQFKEK